MIIKKTLKRLISFTPKWLFNFFVSFTVNKKQKNSEMTLESFYPDCGKSSLRQNRVIVSHRYDLKIIIPCYNVEKFICECLESIMNQKTKYNFVVVLVNDGSTDNTIELIKKYKSEKVIVFNKPNGGLSSARNTALEVRDSEFIMFVDSDDCLLGDRVIEHTLNLAYKTKNEYGESILIEFKHSNSHRMPKYSDSLKRVEYIGLSGFAWAKVFSSNLFDEVIFPEGYWFEDTVLSTAVYPQAKFCFLNKSLIYFYRPSENSITVKSTKSKKTLDTFYVTRQLLSDRKKLELIEDYNYYYRFYMQTICNSVRLKTLPKEIQIKVFFETEKLFKDYTIRPIGQFKQLYKSLSTNNYEQYSKFCALYSKIYLNL